MLVGIMALLPVYFTVQTSFVGGFTGPQNLGGATLATWRAMPWRSLGDWARNSALVVLPTTIVSPVICVAAGYGFAKHDFPLKEPMFYCFLIAMVMPGMFLFVPKYLIIRDMHMVNTLPGLILPNLLNPALVFFSRQYLVGIGGEYLDAARVDGASEWRIFRDIIVPLSIPLLILCAVQSFTVAWGDFMWQYLVARDFKTLTVGVGQFIAAHDQVAELWAVEGTPGVTRDSIAAAAALLQSIPLLIVFVVFQKWFIKGVRI